jgi:tetratricopeptide (TPR) repeat protein
MGSLVFSLWTRSVRGGFGGRLLGTALAAVTVLEAVYSCGGPAVTPSRDGVKTMPATEGVADEREGNPPRKAESPIRASVGPRPVPMQRRECRAIERPDGIARASRPSVLSLTAMDLINMGRFDDAVRVARRAVEVADLEGIAIDRLDARIEYGTALVARADGKAYSFAPGLQVLTDALRRARAELGEEHLRVLHVLIVLGTANNERGQHGIALRYYRDALKIARKIDQQNPGSYPTVVSVGAALDVLCEEGYRPACALWEEVKRNDYQRKRANDGGNGGDQSPMVTAASGRRWTMGLEVLELSKEGKLDDAEIFARVAVLDSEVMPPDLPTVEGHLALAHVLSLRGSHREAMSELDQALSRLNGAKSPNAELRAHVLVHRAAEFLATGDAAASRVDVQDAFRLCAASEEDGDADELLRRFCVEGCPAACTLGSVRAHQR